MPTLIPSRLAAACALALIAALACAAPAAAKGVRAEIRVVTDSGRILAERQLSTGTTAVPTSRRADCFGAGTGGSGEPVRVKGATALGLLAQAARRTASLRALLITDAFDFGLGLCAVGGREAPASGFWYLKVNHENPEVGGELVKLRRGDEVLWYLSPDFEVSPVELVLNAPRRAASGRPFEVRVFAYDDRGRRTPAAGVWVTGARSPTSADGRTTVALDKPARIVARHGTDIPSNRVAVCVSGRCPRG